MATEGTKFQINYKLNDGTLVNLYASSVKELETGLADLAMNATNIKATGIDLSSALVAGAPAPTVESVAAAFAATPVQQYVPTTAPVPVSAGNQCRHGEMAFRSGTSAKGPWKGDMSAAPNGAPDTFDTIWIR